jgi:DNA-binding FadR family transcriptional regulator
MTPERLREILAQEFERTTLPPGAARHIADLRANKHGEAMKAALSAMQRAIDEDRATRGTS